MTFKTKLDIIELALCALGVQFGLMGVLAYRGGTLLWLFDVIMILFCILAIRQVRSEKLK